MSDEITLDDGQTAEIPMPDKIFPTFVDVEGWSDVFIEEGRRRIRDESNSTISLGGVSSNLYKKNGGVDGPVATIHADHATEDGADVYAELALHSVESVKKLHEGLEIMLKYWGEYDE